MANEPIVNKSKSEQQLDGKTIGILPCSGACNVGMLTTRAVVQLLVKKDNINFVCALGIPLGIPGIVNNAKKADLYIALNGCNVKCSTKTLQTIGISPDKELVVVEDLGIPKTKKVQDTTGLDELISRVEQLVDELAATNSND